MIDFGLILTYCLIAGAMILCVGSPILQMKSDSKKTKKMIRSSSRYSGSGRNSNGKSNSITSKLRAPTTKSGIPQRTNSSSSILSDKSNH